MVGAHHPGGDARHARANRPVRSRSERIGRLARIISGSPPMVVSLPRPQIGVRTVGAVLPDGRIWLSQGARINHVREPPPGWFASNLIGPHGRALGKKVDPPPPAGGHGEARGPAALPAAAAARVAIASRVVAAAVRAFRLPDGGDRLPLPPPPRGRRGRDGPRQDDAVDHLDPGARPPGRRAAGVARLPEAAGDQLASRACDVGAGAVRVDHRRPRPLVASSLGGKGGRC